MTSVRRGAQKFQSEESSCRIADLAEYSHPSASHAARSSTPGEAERRHKRVGTSLALKPLRSNGNSSRCTMRNSITTAPAHGVLTSLLLAFSLALVATPAISAAEKAQTNSLKWNDSPVVAYARLAPLDQLRRDFAALAASPEARNSLAETMSLIDESFARSRRFAAGRWGPLRGLDVEHRAVRAVER